MAACGAQACAEEKVDEKVDKPRRLFNYKPSGIRSPEYVPLPAFEGKYDNQEEYVHSSRKTLDEMMEGISKMPVLVDAVKKNIITELVVEKGSISDGDITVYMHRPKNLPKKGCAAMIFVHGGGAITGSARQFIPTYSILSLYYGVVGFNVDYRLAPEHGNKGGMDVYAAVKYVYDNAEKLGIDKTRIGIEGSSAGAFHTFNACNLMSQNGETGMCKVIFAEIGMFTSVVRFTPEKDWKNEELVVGPGLDPMYKCLFGDKYKEYVNNKNPLLFPELVEEDKLQHYPPAVFFSAEFCPFHQANLMLSQRMEKVGKLLEFRLIRGLGHMYAMCQNKETMETFEDRMKCVNTYLKN